MNLSLHDGVVELLPGQILRLRAASGVSIGCDGGTLWVTQEGRTRDDFLSAGDALGITSAGLTLVEAMGGQAARLTLGARRAPGHAAGLPRARMAF